MRKCFSVFISIISCLLFILPLISSAETAEHSNSYEQFTPVRVAVVLDSSGSIKDCNKNADILSRVAAKNFVSLLPKDSSYVSVFEYSYEPRLVTELTPIDTIDSWKKIGDDIMKLNKFEGGTALLKATQTAREYLDSKSKPGDGIKNVIVLFTDGAETERINKNTATEEMISQNVRTVVGDSKTLIYSVAFDYQDEDGSHSISGSDGNGYGKRLLDKLCGDPSQVLVVNDDASELSQKFEEIIYSITHSPIPSNPTEVISSDGKTHDIAKTIPPGVAEANLRIYCNTLDAIKNSHIVLRDPNGDEVNFKSEGVDSAHNTWYSEDTQGVNIKLIEPLAGSWTLTVPTVIGNDDVFISFIPLYNMSLEKPEITFNGKTDISSATIGDTLKVKTKLLSNGKAIEDSDFYVDSEITAKVYISDSSGISTNINTSSIGEISTLLNELPNSISVDMEPANNSFVASVPLTGEPGVKLISIWIYSKDFFCYYESVITVGDGGDIYTIRTPDKIVISNGEKTSIEELVRFCSSDKVNVSLGKYDNSIIDATIINGNLEATGLMPGSVDIPVVFSSKINDSETLMNIQVEVTNSPPKFKSSSYSCVVEQGKKITLDNLEVDDLEEDNLIFSLDSVADTNMIVVTVDSAGEYTVEGKEKGQTSFRINVSDGTSFDTITIIVEVKESKIAALIRYLIIVFAIAIFVLTIILLKNKHKRMYVTLKDIKITYKRKEYSIIDNLTLNIRFKKSKSNLGEVISYALQHSSTDTEEIEDSEIRAEIASIIHKQFTFIKIKGTSKEKLGALMSGKNEFISLNTMPAGTDIRERMNNYNYKSFRFAYNQDNNQLGLKFYCGTKKDDYQDEYEDGINSETSIDNSIDFTDISF